MRRSQLKLRGNSGTAPNAPLALLGKGVLVDDRSQQVRVVQNPQTGQLEPRLLHTGPRTTILPDNTTRREFVIDASGGAAQVRKILLREIKRAKLDNPAINVPTAAEIDQFIANAVQNTQSIERPQILYDLDLNFASVRRGICKIAYELAFRWLGESYIEDPLAYKLRAFILNGVKSQPIRGPITVGTIGALAFWASDIDSHMAHSVVDSGSVFIVLKIFEIFSAAILVSELGANYGMGQFDPETAHFIHINAVSGACRESSLAEELLRLCNTSPVDPFRS